MSSETRLVVYVLRLEISLSQRALGSQYLFGFTSLPLSSLCLIILYRPTFSEGRVMYIPARETLCRQETSVRPIHLPHTSWSLRTRTAFPTWLRFKFRVRSLWLTAVWTRIASVSSNASLCCLPGLVSANWISGPCLCSRWLLENSPDQ